MLKALIFDVDGTLADTEAAHMRAFNQAFAQERLDWHWTLARYTELLAVSGGKERMLHHWREVNPGLRELDGGAMQATIDRLHEVKTAFYEDAVNQGAVAFRPGVLALMEEARAEGLQLAIATTTSPANIAALLRNALGAEWRSWFAAIGDAGNAPIKKPDPQVYLKVLTDMGLSAKECLAFEDSSNGLLAARAASLPTVITPNSFTAHHDFTGALRVVPDLSNVKLAHLREWHAADQT
jgi:HAD superfamily hydrolase (TIGR01509 family)